MPPDRRTDRQTDTRPMLCAMDAASEVTLRPTRLHFRQLCTKLIDDDVIGNVNVPIQLAVHWPAISNDIFSNKTHVSNFIKQHSETVMV